MKGQKFMDLCDDCLFKEHTSVCSLCFGGRNYTARTNIGPIRISLEEYKDVFRYHRWIDMFSTGRLYDVIRKLLADRPTHTKIKAIDTVWKTIVKTKSLLHEQLFGNRQKEEEFLSEADEYFYFRYRDVMYMIHTHKGQLYVKALLDWHEPKVRKES